MNEARFEASLENAKIVREMIELAGLDLETALVTLEAVSERQKNFAGWVRFAGLANIWQWSIKQAYKTPEFAQALIRAANRHKTARWWADREIKSLVMGSFMGELKDDFKAELHHG